MSRHLTGDVYAIKIGDIWYHVRHKMEVLYPPRRKRYLDHSEHIKWLKSAFGWEHCFEIKTAEKSPRQKLPEAVSHFIEKHIRVGSTSGRLITHDMYKGARPPKSSKPGWQ